MVETNLSDTAAKSSKSHLTTRLDDEGERIHGFFTSLQDATWETVVYTEGARWTVRQILAHFIVTEQALRALVEEILTGGAGAPEDFDINTFNETEVNRLDSEPPSALLDTYKMERERTLHMLNGLEESDLLLEGQHPYFGTMTIEQLLKWIYRHASIHLREIRRAIPS